MPSNIKKSVLFFTATVLIGIGLFALDRVPPELFLFDLKTDALSFFRAPLDQFYASVFFSWIEWLRRAELLALILAALALGAIHESTREFPKNVWSFSFAVAGAQVLLFLFLLPKASSPHAASPTLAFLFLAFFFWVKTLKIKEKYA